MSAERGSLLHCPFCGNDKHDSWDGVRMRQQEVTDIGYGLSPLHPERFFMCSAEDAEREAESGSLALPLMGYS